MEARHVWWVDDSWNTRVAHRGLLVDRRRAGSRWEGLVVYSRGGGAFPLWEAAWVPFRQLRLVESGSPG